MSNIKLFESKKVRTHWDSKKEQWFFSVIDVVEILTDSTIPKRYWSDLKKKLQAVGSEAYEKIVRLKTQNLRDHMNEAELIFTALAELSTRQIAETEKAKGLQENAKAGKKGGAIAKNARLALEAKTGKRVVTGENFLPPSKEKKKLK